jgi:hypothetical protein
MSGEGRLGAAGKTAGASGESDFPQRRAPAEVLTRNAARRSGVLRERHSINVGYGPWFALASRRRAGVTGLGTLRGYAVPLDLRSIEILATELVELLDFFQ